jgi:hypothetical protein
LSILEFFVNGRRFYDGFFYLTGSNNSNMHPSLEIIGLILWPTLQPITFARYVIPETIAFYSYFHWPECADLTHWPHIAPWIYYSRNISTDNTGI